MKNGKILCLTIEPLAEELTEDTFVRIVTRKPQFSAKYSFKTWLYTIGRNLAINYATG